MSRANMATIWELHADRQGDSPALIDADTSLTWAQFDDRASRLAAALAEHGVTAGDNVGLCLYNCNHYSEAQFALFKLRAVPFNVNYRYRSSELDALIENSDATAVIFHHDVADQFEPLTDRLADLKAVVQVAPAGAEGSDLPWAVDYERLVDDHDPAPRIDRSGDDLWILFTGGTTGHPKGVMWPHSSILGLMDRAYGEAGIEPPASAAEFVSAGDTMAGLVGRPVHLAAAPLMHGTSGLVGLRTLTLGGTVVTLGSRTFDSAELWQTVDRAGVNVVTIVGDAFARPMLDELVAAADGGAPYHGRSLRSIASSGTMWSAEVKDGILEHLPHVQLADLLGSSEGANIGSKVASAESAATTARFTLSEVAQVFDDDDRPVVPGSGQVGRVAVGGPLPIGYYGDPEKSAATWQVIDGKRWCLAGDMATVEADGSIVLLGRGSNCINTGGEKVFPEEVEEVLKLNPSVHDALAVGVADPRWGQRVTAVVAVDDVASVDGDDLIAFSKQHLAGYKAPKQVVLLDRLERKPNGKADYAWARAVVEAAFGGRID